MELNNSFDKNKYSIYDENQILNNYSKNECKNYCIENNYKGFKYIGDNNKCLLFGSNSFDKNIKSILDKDDYNIKSYIKNKSTIDLNSNDINDQNNVNLYYKEIDNSDFLFKNLLKNINVENKKECLNECLKNENNKCKSVIYLEEPQKCIFSNTISIKPNNDKQYNVYTLNKNNLKNNIDNNYNKMEDDIQMNWTKIRDNTVLYKCNGMDSTNPFCTQPFNPDNIEDNELPYYTKCRNLSKYNNIKEQEKYYNKLCKNEYGNEYIFDNDYLNLDSVIKCNENEERIRCKLNMYGDNYVLEHFDNNIYEETKYKYIFLIFCIILLLFIIFLIKK